MSVDDQLRRLRGYYARVGVAFGRSRTSSMTGACAVSESVLTGLQHPSLDVMKMLARRMDRAGRLAAVRVSSYPIAIDIVREAKAIIANAAAARDLRFLELDAAWDRTNAVIDGFSLAPGGWPRLEDLRICEVDMQLFLPHQVERPASIYPALHALDLANITAPFDSLSLFSSLSELPSLRRLVLWFILFKKSDAPPVNPRLSFRLSHYTYAKKQFDQLDGTTSGWHLPIVTPSKSPKELTLELRDIEDLSPVLDQPGCLDAVETLHLYDDSGYQSDGCLPLEAYSGMVRLCPRLKALRFFAQSKVVLAGLEAQLAQVRIPLRSISVKLVPEPETREALAEDDRAFAELLRTSTALRHLRFFALTTFWELQRIPGLKFPAITAQCRSRAVRFQHDAR